MKYGPAIAMDGDLYLAFLGSLAEAGLLCDQAADLLNKGEYKDAHNKVLLALIDLGAVDKRLSEFLADKHGGSDE